jgi:hypothetical protein
MKIVFIINKYVLNTILFGDDWVILGSMKFAYMSGMQFEFSASGQVF